MINCQSMLGVRASGIWIPFVPCVGFYVDVKLLQSSGRGSVPTVPRRAWLERRVRIGSVMFGDSQPRTEGVGGECRRA